ncbi:uncharacterized protein LOC122925667 [Bufo gargarizans]|uniref:uncharacterized protein LOC122924683 n=1 Tax=Bufo gargarizans TaxID=30331 RepID=UPI001CF3C89C|nr:uncharacterized protein LOC122924683 [Bufo gargarizans]XP_044132953.1 uncharacterized protein LOC122925667 [Bufo gargarizans]
MPLYTHTPGRPHIRAAVVLLVVGTMLVATVWLVATCAHYPEDLPSVCPSSPQEVRDTRDIRVSTLRLTPNLLDTKDNIWAFIATNILNSSDFCITDHYNSYDLFSTCLLAVPTPVSVLRMYYSTAWNDTSVEDADVYAHPNLYAYCSNSSSYSLTKQMVEVDTGYISSAEVCYEMTCSRSHIPMCTQPSRQPTYTTEYNATCLGLRQCKSVTNNMTCTHTIIQPSYGKNVQLPKGWLLTCGTRSWTYVPGNITGGPCTLSRLSMILPPRLVDHSRVPRSLGEALPSDCDSAVHLFSEAEYVSLAVSLVGVPGLATANHRQLSKIACALAKGLNHTSSALYELLIDLQGTRQAVLQNRLTIDYLLLKHNMGCDSFEGMCCFNLSDHAKSIQDHIKAVSELAKDIKRDISQNWWDWFFGWLPGTAFIQRLTVTIVGVIMCMITLCCCAQCIPNILSMCRACMTPANTQETYPGGHMVLLSE